MENVVRVIKKYEVGNRVFELIYDPDKKSAEDCCDCCVLDSNSEDHICVGVVGDECLPAGRYVRLSSTKKQPIPETIRVRLESVAHGGVYIDEVVTLAHEILAEFG